MAKNFDYRLQVGWRKHRKHRKLRKLFGAPASDCWLSLVEYAANHSPTGFLAETLEEVGELAEVADWATDIDPDEFAQALLDASLIDQTTEGYELHDFEYWNAYAADADSRHDEAVRAGILSGAKRSGVKYHDLLDLPTKELRRAVNQRKNDPNRTCSERVPNATRADSQDTENDPKSNVFRTGVRTPCHAMPAQPSPKAGHGQGHGRSEAGGGDRPLEGGSPPARRGGEEPEPEQIPIDPNRAQRFREIRESLTNPGRK